MFILYLGEKRVIKPLRPKLAIWTAYIIFWVFVGLRGHILSDFIYYYPFYTDRHLSIINLFTKPYTYLFEPGYVLYAATLKTLGFSYFGFIAVSTLIDLAVLAWFFRKYCSSMILPLIFFIAFNGILMEFNLLRNFKAIDCFLLSFPYLQNRKLPQYLLLNLIGVTFHTSAVLYLPLFFVLHYKMSKWVIWGGFAIANIVYLFQIQLISGLLDHLTFIRGMQAYDKIMGYSKKAVEYKFSIGYIERTFAFILFSLLQKKLIRKRRYNSIFYNSFWIYYCSFLFFYEVTVFSERIPYLFMFSYWILYPQVIGLKFKAKKFIVPAIALLVVMKIVASYKLPSSRYENVITGASSYTKRRAIYFQDAHEIEKR